MDDLIAALKLYTEKTSLTARELKNIDVIMLEIDEAIVSAVKEIDIAKSRDPAMGYFEAKEIALELGRNFFMEKVTEAATSSVEYAYNPFLSPLIELADDEALYKVTDIGGGWGQKISVHLAMDEVAGTIQDYADGVESARGALGVKDDRDGAKASYLWRTRFYQGPRYYTTINLRLASAPGKAPFWSLLNDGNKGRSMSSNIDGGVAYPDVSPTHFVEETEAAIEREFRFQMAQIKDRSDTYIWDIQKMILDAKVIKTRMKEKINSISLKAEEMDIISKELGVDKTNLSSTKLYKAKEQLKSGQYKERYEIGAPGGKRKRIRRGRFLKIVGGFNE